MNTEQLAGQITAQAWREEIEHAVDNVKRSAWDKHFRKRWHIAAARRRRERGRAGARPWPRKRAAHSRSTNIWR